jgi:hypothetical protein
MKYSTVLFGVLATASMASAAVEYGYGPPPAVSSKAPAPSKYVAPAPAPEEDDCDDYPMSSTPVKVAAKPSSSKKATPESSKVTPESSKKAPAPASSEKPKTTPAPSSKKVSPVVKYSSSFKPVYPYPVVTETIIIVVEEFTVPCHGPTTIIEESETIIVTVLEETIITFSHGPYTRTKTHLECGPTTTEYYSEAPCPTGWPYVAGQGYTPLPVSYTPCEYPIVAVETAYPVVAASGAPAPVYAPAPAYAPAPVAPAPAAPGYAPAPAPVVAAVPAYPSAAPSSPIAVFNTSGASRTQAGVVALIAGVVAAMMVL